MTGSPPNYGFTGIWGCKADDTGCAGSYTYDAACDTPYGGTLATQGVPDSLIAVDDTMYTLIGSASGTLVLYSTNYGQTWTDSGQSWPPDTGNFVPESFVQHGAGDAGGSATYLYVLGRKQDTFNATYMARAPKATVTNAGTWEYFAGTAESPAWGSWGNATTIFVDSGALYTTGKMQWFPVIQKYIYTETRGQIQKFGMYEAAKPWGPWKTIYINDTWGNYGTTEGLWYSIIPSSISENNMTF